MFRIGGLASGMNTDDIIKKMIDAQRIPLNKLNQKKQLLEWKRDDYRGLNNKILEFKNASFDMKLQSSYNAKKVTSSQENIVTASGSSLANEGQYTLQINELAKAPTITSGELLTASGGQSTIGELGLVADTNLDVIGPKGSASIEIKTGQTIDSLIKEINKESTKTGVKASYDSTMDRIFFTSTVTGEDAVIDLSLENDEDLSSILKNSVGLPVTATGDNAEVVFNGIPSEYSSNTFSILGITFTAKEKSATIVNVNVVQDIESSITTIKKFVEKYNSLIDEVNKELTEKRYRNFQPLTAAERDDMSEEEIKRWEEKAKSGMLADDQLLSSGLNSLRRSLSDSVQGLPPGQLKSLAEIGISSTNVLGSTITGSYADKGKLYIDETKLKAALIDHPDEVMAVFTTNGATDSNDGIATRLYDKATLLFKQITEKAGTLDSIENKYALGRESLEINERLDRLTLRLTDLETRYYKQFTAMEKYINQMNSQSAWLTQQFSS